MAKLNTTYLEVYFHQPLDPGVAVWTDAAYTSQKDLSSQGGDLMGLVDSMCARITHHLDDI